MVLKACLGKKRTRILRGVMLIGCVCCNARSALAFHRQTSFNARLHRQNIVAEMDGRMYDSATKSKERLDDESDQDNDDDIPANGQQQQRLSRVRSRVKDLARKMVQVPIHVASTITPMPQAIAAVLKDTTFNAVDMAVEEGTKFRIIKLRLNPERVQTFIFITHFQ
jgi:hypothetical protein